MISVIIPAYNAGKHIKRMLQSITLQTINDFEVIIIDDGSSDNTGTVCQSFIKKDNRFKYYYQHNQGVSAARNKGFRCASGDYIAFLDSDDRIDENYFEKLLEACKNTDIAVCDVVIENDFDKIKCFTGNDSIISNTDAIDYLLQRNVINSGPCGKLFRRSTVEGIYFPDMQTYEDILFVLSAFDNAETISITSKTQYHYIENDNGAMNAMKKAPSTDIIIASEKIMSYIDANSSCLNEKCLYVTISHVFQYVLSMVTGECEWNKAFITNARKFYKKHIIKIFKCNAVPTKEKIVFGCFAFGWAYVNKKWFNVKRKI